MHALTRNHIVTDNKIYSPICNFCYLDTELNFKGIVFRDIIRGFSSRPPSLLVKNERIPWIGEIDVVGLDSNLVTFGCRYGVYTAIRGTKLVTYIVVERNYVLWRTCGKSDVQRSAVVICEVWIKNDNNKSTVLKSNNGSIMWRADLCIRPSSNAGRKVLDYSWEEENTIVCLTKQYGSIS